MEAILLHLCFCIDNSCGHTPTTSQAGVRVWHLNDPHGLAVSIEAIPTPCEGIFSLTTNMQRAIKRLLAPGGQYQGWYVFPYGHALARHFCDDHRRNLWKKIFKLADRYVSRRLHYSHLVPTSQIGRLDIVLVRPCPPDPGHVNQTQETSSLGEAEEELPMEVQDNIQLTNGIHH